MDEAKSCSFCGSPNVTPKCSLCKQEFYCNKECQQKHWKAHKPTCPGYCPARSINDFSLLEYMGFGNFSEILHVEEIRTRKQFALKKLNKQRVSQLRKQADVLMEKHALSRLSDLPGVVKLYECFKDDFDLYFLTERIHGGELWEKCKFFGMPEEEAQFYLRSIIHTLSQVHARGIVHRDLKTENILLTYEGNTKLIDFGTAKDNEHPEIEVPGNSMRNKKFENFVGTPHFMAPECVNNKESTFSSDVWSLGCMIFFMLCGYPPFQGGSDYLIFTKSLKVDYSFPEFISECARDIISRCIALDAASRPSMEELKSHPFISGGSLHFPVPTLQALALGSLRASMMQKFTTETATEGLQAEFAQVFTVLPGSPLLQHTMSRLQFYFSRNENNNQQGI